MRNMSIIRNVNTIIVEEVQWKEDKNFIKTMEDLFFEQCKKNCQDFTSTLYHGEYDDDYYDRHIKEAFKLCLNDLKKFYEKFENEGFEE